MKRPRRPSHRDYLDAETACLLADLALGTWTPRGAWSPPAGTIRMCWRSDGRLIDFDGSTIAVDAGAVNDRGPR